MITGVPVRLSALLGDAPVLASMSDVEITGLTLDSRTARDGYGFVALRGASHHGLEHAKSAAANGARCVLWEPGASGDGESAAALVRALGVPVIAVPNLRGRLGGIADRLHGEPSRDLAITGVTGTNGKTSFVQLLAQALGGAGHRVATIGTLGAGLVGSVRSGERTTPDVLSLHACLAEFRAAGATHVAMEVSSHALDQGRVDGVRFTMAVFTNLTRDHLDYHGDMLAYGAAKARLFSVPELRCAVVNADDEFGRQLLASLPASQARLSYGLGDSSAADVRGRAIRFTASGVEFELVTPWGDALIHANLLGNFNVANLLAVAATLGALGWKIDAVAQALSRSTPVPGRMHRLGGEGALPLVVIDYAHTPDALAQALDCVRGHTRGELHVVFGCGGERDSGKRPLMARVAEHGADRITVTDDNPRSESGDAIIEAILAGFEARRRAHIEVDRDRARAITAAVHAAGFEDAVLIAGKGHERYQETLGVRRPFDDTEVAQAALASRA